MHAVLLLVTGVVCLVLAALALSNYASGQQQNDGGGSSMGPPSGAIVARSMADLTWGDSLVYPPGAAEEIRNIQETSPGVFRCILRHRGSWYDGDRDLQNNKEGKDKSRAEISSIRKGMHRPYNVGETWLIGTTVKLDKDFVPARGYCNIMQPLNHQSFVNLTRIRGDVVTGGLYVFEDGIGSPITTVRTFQLRRGEWTTVVVRVRVGKDGEYGLSINGDSFVTKKFDTTKSGDRTPPFGGNWGLYSSATKNVNGGQLKDLIVDHKDIFIKKLS